MSKQQAEIHSQSIRQSNETRIYQNEQTTSWTLKNSMAK
jgi:hypothetical protein